MPDSTQLRLEAVNDVLQAWGERIIAALAEALPRNKDTTGHLRDSIKFTFTRFGMPITFQLTIADYYKYVDAGRIPGAKFPPPNVIRKWIIDRRFVLNDRTGKIQPLHATMPRKGKIPRRTAGQTDLTEAKIKSLTFLIGRKIHRYGIKPTPFFTDTVTDQEISDLKAALSKAFKQDVLVNIVQYKDSIK